MDAPPKSASSSLRSRIAETAVCYVAAALYLAHLEFLRPWLPEPDSYYHIKAAWIFRTRGVPQRFPWAYYSMWRDRYYDKDFGFHMLLRPFTYGDLAFGGKLAAAMIGAGIFASFYSILRARGLRSPWLWTLLLVSAGGYFIWRTDVTRPQILSMSLALWSMYLVLEEKILALVIVSALYALSYTAPHVAVVMAVASCAAVRVFDRRWAWKPIAATVGGVLVGWCLHPHFPRNFEAWGVQIVDVLASAWGASRGPDLRLGGEFLPADSRSMLTNSLSVYVAVLVALVMAPRIGRKVDSKLTALFVVTNGFIVMTCLTKRFVEYSFPFTLWLCAEVLTRWAAVRLEDGALIWPTRRRSQIMLGAAVLLGCAALFAHSHRQMFQMFRETRPSDYQQAATGLLTRAPPNAIVFTCDWDDAPELFFYNERQRYLVFLDPSYMYQWSPRTWELWTRIANGHDADPVYDISHSFGARWGVCTNDFGLGDQLEHDPRVKIRLRTHELRVFELLSTERRAQAPVHAGAATPVQAAATQAGHASAVASPVPSPPATTNAAQ